MPEIWRVVPREFRVYLSLKANKWDVVGVAIGQPHPDSPRYRVSLEVKFGQ
jgi:hypothetical protein